MNELELIWDFRSPKVSIESAEIPLECRYEKDCPVQISNIITQTSNIQTFLFSKNTILIPPKSSVVIQIKSSKIYSPSLPDEVFIIPNERFESNILVHVTLPELVKEQHLVTTTINLRNSGIRIKRNQIVAK